MKTPPERTVGTPGNIQMILVPPEYEAEVPTAGAQFGKTENAQEY
jgi:hypothetical protein